MEIFVPPALSQFEDFISTIKEFLDPKERKKIEDDIIRYHVLNDGEAKKHADAQSLIKEHSDILEETRKIRSDIEAKEKKLEKEKIQFKVEMDTENSKLLHERESIKNEIEKANKLNAQAIETRNNVENRENTVKTERIAIDADAKKNIEDNIALSKRKKEIDDYHETIKKLDSETRVKVEKLKQFNF